MILSLIAGLPLYAEELRVINLPKEDVILLSGDITELPSVYKRLNEFEKELSNA